MEINEIEKNEIEIIWFYESINVRLEGIRIRHNNLLFQEQIKIK